MSINPSVTEALDSLLAGLDSLRAERDDLTAAQLSGRALAPSIHLQHLQRRWSGRCVGPPRPSMQPVCWP